MLVANSYVGALSGPVVGRQGFYQAFCLRMHQVSYTQESWGHPLITGNLRTLDILRVLAKKRVEESPQLGGLRVHLCRLSSVWHTYYFTKSCQRHGQKIIINSKLKNTSIMIISETINKIGGEFMILRNTACCKPWQTCISTKAVKLLFDTCGFKESFTWMRHCMCRTRI